ncbi:MULTISPECIES: hypothetical protein [unclassified Mesorhizobium]|uniref:hypothetical protein n=1 Tax=unclassified Mesorhizobium TaxID=325217 RepID=UPI00333BAE4D
MSASARRDHRAPTDLQAADQAGAGARGVNFVAPAVVQFLRRRLDAGFVSVNLAMPHCTIVSPAQNAA